MTDQPATIDQPDPFDVPTAEDPTTDIVCDDCGRSITVAVRTAEALRDAGATVRCDRCATADAPKLHDYRITVTVERLTEEPCPRDTDGDGDCGQPRCPDCGPDRPGETLSRFSPTVQAYTLAGAIPKFAGALRPGWQRLQETARVVEDDL